LKIFIHQTKYIRGSKKNENKNNIKLTGLTINNTVIYKQHDFTALHFKKYAPMIQPYVYFKDR